LAERSQVSVACKRIVRHICTRGLVAGDSIPSERELRRMYGFSNCTLTPAMRILVDLGLIERRARSMTRVLSLDPLHRLTWTVGVVTMDTPISGPGAAHALILHSLQSQLARRRCVCHVYFRDANPHWPHRIGDFPGLAEDIAEHAIDGLITLDEMDGSSCAAFDSAGIPAVECGYFSSRMPSAILLDYQTMISEAATQLFARGARQVALVGSNPEETVSREIMRQAFDGTPGVVTEVIPANPGRCAGEAVARALLQRPAEHRPDGLIFIDDFTAVGAVQTLADHPDYRPRVAALVNKQLPQAWAWPVIRCENDLEEVAARGVRMLCEAMLNPSLPPHQERVRVKMAEG
jgi:hypothetical protein